MDNKTIITTQTFDLIASFKITKTLLHNIIVHLINFTKEMHHVNNVNSVNVNKVKNSQ